MFVNQIIQAEVSEYSCVKSINRSLYGRTLPFETHLEKLFEKVDNNKLEIIKYGQNQKTRNSLDKTIKEIYMVQQELNWKNIVNVYCLQFHYRKWLTLMACRGFVSRQVNKGSMRSWLILTHTSSSTWVVLKTKVVYQAKFFCVQTGCIPYTVYKPSLKYKL